MRFDFVFKHNYGFKNYAYRSLRFAHPHKSKEKIKTEKNKKESLVFRRAGQGLSRFLQIKILPANKFSA